MGQKVRVIAGIEIQDSFHANRILAQTLQRERASVQPPNVVAVELRFQAAHGEPGAEDVPEGQSAWEIEYLEGP